MRMRMRMLMLSEPDRTDASRTATGAPALARNATVVCSNAIFDDTASALPHKP